MGLLSRLPALALRSAFFTFPPVHFFHFPAHSALHGSRGRAALLVVLRSVTALRVACNNHVRGTTLDVPCCDFVVLKLSSWFCVHGLPPPVTMRGQQEKPAAQFSGPSKSDGPLLRSRVQQSCTRLGSNRRWGWCNRSSSCCGWRCLGVIYAGATTKPRIRQLNRILHTSYCER